VQAAQAPPPVPQAAFVVPVWATPAAQQPVVKQTPPHTFAFAQHAPPISVKPELHSKSQVLSKLMSINTLGFIDDDERSYPCAPTSRHHFTAVLR